MLYILFKMFLRKIPLYQENKGQNHQAEIFFDKKHQFKIKNINLGNIIGKKASTFTVCLFSPSKRTQNQQQWNSGKTLEPDKTILLSIESLLKNSYPATSNLIVFSKSFTLHFFFNNLIKLGQTEKSWKEVGNEEGRGRGKQYYLTANLNQILKGYIRLSNSGQKTHEVFLYLSHLERRQ